MLCNKEMQYDNSTAKHSLLYHLLEEGMTVPETSPLSGNQYTYTCIYGDKLNLNKLPSTPHLLEHLPCLTSQC